MMEREKIIDAVRDWLDNDDWHYEYDAERQVIKAGIALKSKVKSGKIAIVFAEKSYTVYLTSPISGDENDLSELVRYITYANYGLRNGNFEVDQRDGEVRYKIHVNCEGMETLPEQIIGASIYVPCIMMDRYGNGIAALALGFSDADTEIKKAEEEDESDDESSED